MEKTPPPPLESRPFDRAAYELIRIADALVKIQHDLHKIAFGNPKQESFDRAFQEAFHSEPEPDTVDGAVVDSQVRSRMGFRP